MKLQGALALSFLLVSLLVQHSEATCCSSISSQWVSYSNIFCMWESPVRSTYVEAMEMCENVGGRLIEIFTEAQNNAVTDHVQTSGPAGPKRFWLGLHRLARDDFGWYEFPVGYTNFTANEQMQNKEFCVSIDDDGDWHYERCDRELPYLCYRFSPGCGGV